VSQDAPSDELRRLAVSTSLRMDEIAGHLYVAVSIATVLARDLPVSRRRELRKVIEDEVREKHGAAQFQMSALGLLSEVFPED